MPLQCCPCKCTTFSSFRKANWNSSSGSSWKVRAGIRRGMIIVVKFTALRSLSQYVLPLFRMYLILIVLLLGVVNVYWRCALLLPSACLTHPIVVFLLIYILLSDLSKFSVSFIILLQPLLLISKILQPLSLTETHVDIVLSSCLYWKFGLLSSSLTLW